MKRTDKQLGMDRRITRRDFLNGSSVAVGGSAAAIGASATVPTGQPPGSHATPTQDPESYYPPRLTGMRGSHDGSFEVAHEMRYGKTWNEAEESGEQYDLVVVGAGLSGLAAAYYFRKALPEARVLVLDNHDDFGGHAKRVEFTVGDRQLIGYGGTQFITGYYPAEAKDLLEDIGVSAERFPGGSANDLYSEMGLRGGVFFDRETFGTDRLVVGEPRRARGAQARRRWTDFLAQTPLSEAAKAGILQLYTENRDYLPELSDEEKIARLRKMRVSNVRRATLPRATTHSREFTSRTAMPASRG